jgi:DNA modification methylase
LNNYKIFTGDVIAGLRTLRAESVQVCVTSPPYFGLRDYGTARWEGGKDHCDHKQRNNRNDGNRSNVRGFYGNANLTGHADMGARQFASVCGKCGARRVDAQIGLEETPAAYVERLVAVFREVKRVLKADGTVWLNLGDSYATGGMSNPSLKSTLQGGKDLGAERYSITRARPAGLKPKDLIGIPWRVAFALQADGWYLRQDIIWAKPNPMPESVRDRCTKSHEYVFLLAKSERYYYDADAVREVAVSSGPRQDTGEQAFNCDIGMYRGRAGNKPDGKRNRRSVWTITPRPYKGAHFAVFPEALVEPCILAGSAPGDLVLDPFAGSGTTGAVARRLGRGFRGCELNPEYVSLAQQRIAQAA